MNLDTPVLGAAGLRRFLDFKPDAVAAVTERFYSTPGTSCAAFGASGRAACRQDLGYHLEFLGPVLQFGLVQPMVDYLNWLASVLVARGIPAENLSLSLDWLGEFYATRMTEPDAGIVVDALRRAREQFDRSRAARPSTDDDDGAHHAHLLHRSMPTPWPESESFQTALLAGDRRRAWSLIDGRLARDHSLVEAEMHMIQPALYGIGQKWQENQVSVAQEHLATAISQSLMTQGLLKSDMPPANGRKILLACVAGNHHSVGLQMVADAFQLDGWDVQCLGANVPTRVLIEHTQLYKPDLLGLSVAFAQELGVVSEVIAHLTDALGSDRPGVIIGGLAINQFGPIACELGADAWSADARSAVTSGSGLAAQRHPG